MKSYLLLLLCLFLTQCISTQITPVTGGLNSRQKVYIVRNEADFMEEFLPTLERQVKELGYSTEVVGQAPTGNVCYLTYQANWRWDMAMYLSYFRATLHEGTKIIATGEYDARFAGLALTKFGHTETKMRPVVQGLFGKVQP